MSAADTLDTTPARVDAGDLTVAGAAASTSATEVYAEHADFVFASLQRFGIRDNDLEDLLQEVFVVVHRKLHTFDGSSRMTTWLYAISLRVAAAHRRRAHVRREQSVDPVPEPSGSHTSGDPEAALQRGQARRQLEAILDELDLDKRAVFVMFEIDELSCDEIAVVVGAPVGTVYSRLHAARAAFREAVARHRARRGPR
jgi:RNA polymerase sigma-70 factor (ECF subfamily)